jgi:hypothetical protein
VTRTSLRLPEQCDGTKQFVVQAIYRYRDLAGNYVSALSAARQNFAVQLDSQMYLKLVPGVGTGAGRLARPGPERVPDRAVGKTRAQLRAGVRYESLVQVDFADEYMPAVSRSSPARRALI